MKETLVKKLEGMNGDELVYIGCKDGTNFIVIDTVDSIINGLTKIDKYLHDRVERYQRKSINNLSTLPFKITEVLERINSGTLSNKELGKAKNVLRNYENKYASAHQARINCERQLSWWIPFGDRKVIDTYPHTVDDPGTTILVEGSFQGDLWWKGENKSILDK